MVPFTVVLTVLGAWAERARPEDGGPGVALSVARSPGSQPIEHMTAGVSFGPEL